MPKKLFIFFWIALSLIHFSLQAQKDVIKGQVISKSDGNPIYLVNVKVKGHNTGSSTDEEGFFEIKTPNESDLVLLEFSHIQYQSSIISLDTVENLQAVKVALLEKVISLEGVSVEAESTKEKEQAGLLKLNPKTVQKIPTAFVDFNQKIAAIGLGVYSNNELSSTYSVRGGNYEENLVYVNGIEIYRPFLVRSGQQEGLSFINPDMVKEVEFSSGGWQPKYGDKLSSVLSVEYKKPTAAKGRVMGSLLSSSAYVEGSAINEKFTYVLGGRYKSARYLLNTLDVNGQYLPRFFDLQGYFTYQLSKEKDKTTLSLLTSLASNQYEVAPESQSTRFGTFQSPMNLRVFFAGTENLNYDTFQSGLSLKHKFSDKVESRFTMSGLKTREREYVDLEKAYLLCEVNNDINSSEFNKCALVIGVGAGFDYARNTLDAEIYSFINNNTVWFNSNTKMNLGFTIKHEKINDKLYEYGVIDSADYVTLDYSRETFANIESWRPSGYIQNTHYIGETQTLTYGARLSYWSFNEQFLFSPRLQYSISPNWNKDFSFKLATGIYQQAPFYRELRDFEGNINSSLKAQSSFHTIVGMDYGFESWGRPFKFKTELYYKKLWDVIPYDIDNVRLRYYANNNAKAYIWGADFRLSGEFIPNTESWLSLGILSAKEDLENDDRGWVRRPTDQLINFAMFFQDHLPNNPSMQVHMRFLYGSGLPYGPPNSLKFRAALKGGNSYKRLDVGFSKVILFGNGADNNLKSVESLRLGIEVLNLLGIENNISFTWVEDVFNIQYAVPNTLSQRFFNVKAVAHF